MAEQNTYHHGNLREALIEAAMKSLEEVGLEELSLRELAATVGVSKAAPYRHFPSKRDLLVALASEGYMQFANALEDAEAELSQLSPQDCIRGVYELYGKFALDRPERYRLMFSRLGNSLHSEKCRLNGERAFASLLRISTTCWPDMADNRQPALSLFAALHGWTLLLLDELIPPAAGVDKSNFMEFAIPPGAVFPVAYSGAEADADAGAEAVVNSDD